ncbi:FDD123-like protein 1 [Seiridium cupressi]
MDFFLPRDTNTLQLGTPNGVDEVLSQPGADWLWAVTAICITSFIGLLIFCFGAPESDRVFHYLFTCALLVGSVTHFAEASGLGWISVAQVDQLGQGLSRQIFYTKYINWARPHAPTTDYKLGFFAFGTFAWLILALSTLNESRESAGRLGIVRDYMILAGWINLVWLIYPVAFGLSDGGNRIGITGSFIIFGVLDVLLLPLSAFAFVVLGRKWNYQKLNLAFSEPRNGSTGSLSLDKEEQPASIGVAETSV